MKLKYGAFILALLGAVILLQKPSARSAKKESVAPEAAPAVSLSQKSQGSQNAEVQSARNEKVKSSALATVKTSPTAEASSSATPSQATAPSQEQVTDWAVDLGKSMLEAMHKPERSFKMFEQLQKCVEDAGQAEVYRAICAANLKRLSEKFPDRFAQKYSSVQLSFDEKIRTFLAQANTNF